MLRSAVQERKQRLSRKSLRRQSSHTLGKIVLKFRNLNDKKLPIADFTLDYVKKCDSSASLSSTDSCDWDERKRTISANIKRKLGSVSSRKQVQSVSDAAPPSPAVLLSPANLMSGVNLKEALICQFPDGTEEIGAAKKGTTLREMLSPIFDRRNMSMSEYAVFLEQSNTPLKYSFDTFPLAGMTLLIQGDHYDATNEFTYNATASFSRPKLHDPGLARSLHDDTADIPDRLNRSNSLEFDEHISSIRRTHSEKEKHETESSEYSGISGKAKSISEQMDRIKSNLNKAAGIPPLDFTDWKELVPESVVQGLGKKDMEQQHHIWELVTTEHNHITIISTVINSLLTCLKELHNENFLTKINEHDVFLNIERIREVHLAFWNECIVPLIDKAKDTGEPLDPEILTGSSHLFEENLNPLFEYCIKYIESRSYIKSQQHKNNDFKEYINWCSNEIRVQHNKLGVDDMLIKPIQRIQKYPILIKDILRKTTDDDTRSVLSSFLEKVKGFVESLNRQKEEKEEQAKIEGIKERIGIESYSVLPSVGHNTNEQINQMLNKYNKFDLADKVPLLNTQRKFLHETSCKLDSKLDSKTQDVTLFLFSDHILVTRPNKGSKKKNRIIKQPMTLDRVEIEELSNASHTNVVVYLNEYGSLVDMFLLQSTSQESHQTLFNAVIQAKDNYKREKNKLYTDMDASKSVSTCSVNSAGNHQAESPAVARHAACSVTRSHSELGPTRRTLVDPSSSVSRAQSMPASNEKRNHLPQPQPMSSASSSSSSSSCSVSEGGGSEGSSRLVTLSHIKESDKSIDSGEELTVIPNSDTLTGGNDPDTLKNYGPDVYISDNLSTEFKGKLDLNKKICDSVNLQAPDEKMLFTKSDAIFIDHANTQSES